MLLSLWNLVATQISLCQDWATVMTHMKHMVSMHPMTTIIVQMSHNSIEQIARADSSSKIRRVIDIVIMKNLRLYQNNI